MMKSDADEKVYFVVKCEHGLGVCLQSAKQRMRKQIDNEQECIPVGCVPAARWPYAGVCFEGGCT